MRYLFTRMFICLMLLRINSMAQSNLVPNPSFEDTISCPGLSGPNIIYANHWAAYKGTPDYLHPCANSGPIYPNGQPVYGVPNNIGGYQIAKHGSAYAGLYTWCCSVGLNQREFMGTILNSYLTIGTKYYFSCYISNGDSVESNSATNNFGMTLSTIPYNGTPGFTMVINNFSHVKVDTIMDDKINWVRLSGSIVADSAYRFLALGNFYNDANTLISNVSASVPLAYYYVDAVCLTTDSLYDLTWTAVDEIQKVNEVKLFPNPADNYFNIDNDFGAEYISISDLSGRILKKITISMGRNKVVTDEFENGIYLITFDKGQTQKLVVFH